MSAAPELSSVKRALSAHAAIGLITGGLLYLVCLTGTVAVFYPELQRLEQAVAPEMETIAPDAVQRGVEAVLASEKGKPPTTHLYVHMPVEDLPRATITTDTQAVHLNADGSIAGPEEIAWSDFLVALHYTLNIPGLFGMTLVGALGAMILALSISGVLAHPRIFRDAFCLRARDHSGVGLADWHNRLSVWTLPFSVAIALTGAVIGLGSLSVWGLAQLRAEGDVTKIYAPLFGPEGKPDARPAPAPDVAGVLRAMAQRYPSVKLTYVILHEPQTVGQEVQIAARHSQRLIFGEYYRFDAQARYLGAAGMADGDLGQQAAASTYSLHFGDYGGLLVKLAYVLFGAALTAICATGVYIWLGKRRRRGFAEPRLARLWDGVVWGGLLVLAATLIARVVLGNAVLFVPVFWLGLALVLIMAAALPTDPARFRTWIRALSGAATVLSAVMLLI
jgi:uncharacterized iron-regulated membrane protein